MQTSLKLTLSSKPLCYVDKIGHKPITQITIQLVAICEKLKKGLPSNKCLLWISTPHLILQILKKVPQVLIQGFTISDSTLKKSSKSNPLLLQNFQDKVKIAETLVFQRTIHHPLECMPAWRKTSAHGIFPG